MINVYDQSAHARACMYVDYLKGFHEFSAFKVQFISDTVIVLIKMFNDLHFTGSRFLLKLEN